VLKLKEKLETAESFEEWAQYAKVVDNLEGKDQWKFSNQS